jgi:hypothetical protein
MSTQATLSTASRWLFVWIKHVFVDNVRSYMTNIALFAVVTFCSCLINCPSRAKIRIINTVVNRINVFFIDGVIDLGDESEFASAVSDINSALIFLQSPGGSPLAAIEMGKLIRLRRFSTIVPKDALCASACALIWLGGSHRLVDKQGALGFHASYIDTNGQLLESGVANALVGRYLTIINLNERAVIFVTSAPPRGMNWLTPQNIADSGIEAEFFDASENQGTEQLSTQAPAPEAYDPITAASLFYSYLSRADGNAAAAMVVPEKRGIGPFNESNIAKFFGSLKEPLKVNSVTRIDNISVAVSYSYTRPNGTICSSVATVSTTYRYGKTLIEKILAKC